MLISSIIIGADSVLKTLRILVADPRVVNTVSNLKVSEEKLSRALLSVMKFSSLWQDEKVTAKRQINKENGRIHFIE